MPFRLCTSCFLRVGVLPGLEQSPAQMLSPFRASLKRKSPLRSAKASVYRQYASKSKPSPKSQLPIRRDVPLKPNALANAARSKQELGYAAREAFYAQTLSQRLSPTPLYVGSASRVYPWSCIFIGSWCLAYGAWHLYDAYFIAHPGLLWIIPHLMAGVAVFVAGSGVWVLLGAKGHLASITAVPSAISQAASTAAKAKSTTTLLIQAERQALLPFSSRQNPRVVQCDVDGAQLGRRIKSILAEQHKEDTEIRRRRAEGSSAWKTLTSPIRNFYWFLARGIARIIQREGFANLHMNGQTYKIDVRNGWLLDNGTALAKKSTIALDRLLKSRS